MSVISKEDRMALARYAVMQAKVTSYIGDLTKNADITGDSNKMIGILAKRVESLERLMLGQGILSSAELFNSHVKALQEWMRQNLPDENRELDDVEVQRSHDDLFPDYAGDE